MAQVNRLMDMEGSNPEFTTIDRDDTSLWFRPLRQLLEQGKPLGPTKVLAFGTLPEGNLPFGALSETRKGRIIFWPVLPRRFRLCGDEHAALVTDHATLELPSGKIHVTSYDEGGQVAHHSQGWRLRASPVPGFAVWFQLLVRRSVLQEQLNAVDQNVSIPTTDQERRVAEFRKYAQQLHVQRVQVPPGADAANFFFCEICVKHPGSSDTRKPPDVHQIGPFPDGLIKGWADDDQIVLQPMRLTLGEVELLVVTGSPPGELTEEYFGFPQAPRRNAGNRRIPHNGANTRPTDAHG